MDHGYEAYCLVDPVFYDSPAVTRGDDVDWAIAMRPVPEGWTRSCMGDWLVYRPAETVLPQQGWKVHASSCLDDAEAVLAAVWDYCVARRLPFKFVRSKQLLLVRNGKNADRGASGKFVTMYPQDESQLETVLTELGALLQGRAGPYILSDLRWGDGPLYVRYGGFLERVCLGPEGELVPAIADPEGRLVPDERGPVFRPPAWLPLPGFLEPHLEARRTATLDGLPYRIDEALHFSNGGGVYAAVDTRTADRVVIKEGRPHAGLAADGTDAVGRLAHERAVLERLAGLDCVPAVRDRFTAGEHHFLVEEYVDGTALREEIATRNPLTSWQPGAAVRAAYAAWAVEVCGRVEEAVAAIHERGILIGDLHPFNVLLRPDGRVVLIDFEVAADVAGGRRPRLGVAGFAAPRDRSGFDIDRYALACLRLFMFLPVTAVIDLDPDKAADLAAAIAGLFPLPGGFLDEAVRVIRGDTPPRAPRARVEASADRWPDLRDSMVRAILASATPHRADRLFPGDVAQFDGPAGGLNVAHGAAGVLYALAAAGAARFADGEQWLVERALRPEPGMRMGLYDGLHGVAYALDVLGQRSDALEVLAICSAELEGRWDRLGLDLAGGLSGIGLSLVHFAEATGDATLLREAERVTEMVAGRLGAVTDVPEISGAGQRWAGLTRGSSGPAMLFLRLHGLTGDPALVDLAETALRQDLRRCHRRDDGVLEVDEGWRTMPYLADGSAGICLALEEYLARRDDEALRRTAAEARRAALAHLYVEPGLFYGRAGMVLALSRGHPPGTAAERDAGVREQVARLDWHAVRFRDGLAFPGEQLLRLSMDLSSGTAGVLLAMASAMHGAAVDLPALRAPGTAPSQRDQPSTHQPHAGGDTHGHHGPAGPAAQPIGPRTRGQQRSQQAVRRQVHERLEPAPLLLEAEQTEATAAAPGGGGRSPDAPAAG